MFGFFFFIYIDHHINSLRIETEKTKGKSNNNNK